MHPNPAFRKQGRSRNIAFARDRGFGVLAVSAPGVPLISHIPFLLSEDGALAEFHLVRSNPITRVLGDAQPARLVVQGPHSYVSPDWYEVDEQVPTWNYVAVHLTGSVEMRPPEELKHLLDRQSAQFEALLLPKPPWVMSKMSVDVRDRMMRQIVPCRMQVAEVHGTWKLNQNKPDEVRLRAANQVAAHGIGNERDTLAEWMHSPPADDA